METDLCAFALLSRRAQTEKHDFARPRTPTTTNTVSYFASVPAAPADALFGLMAKYKADTFDKKVDLGVGAYRDNTGKPWVLPVVSKVDSLIVADPTANHEYLPITGLPDFTKSAAKLILGPDSPAIKENRVASCQTISGTGANHLGSLFLSRFPSSAAPPKSVFLSRSPPSPGATGDTPPRAAGGRIWISNPTWANHKQIFENVGLTVKQYPYWDPKTLGLDLKGMLNALENETRPGDIVLLHACAHNPTGVDPAREEWEKIAAVCKSKKLFPFFDSAYQGFASGDLERDAWAVQYFVSQGLELLICQSFAKNFGLYGQRAGCLHFITQTAKASENVKSQLAFLQRSEISNPPIYGARIVARVLNNPELFNEWKENLLEMANRIKSMRDALKSELIKLDTPGNWDHITNQIGMFSFTGLSPQQVDRLVNEFHVYLTKNGRISMAGLNTHNVAYVAKAFDAVVRG